MSISFIRKLSPLLLAVMLLSSGCWDRKEFNQLAIAQNIAIDYENETYKLTVQLVMPSASDVEISSDSMWLIDGEGASVAEALQQISRSAPRELYLNHLDLVLLGEGLLQHDTGQGLAYLLEENVLRRRTNLLAVQGSAGELLQTKLKLADVDVYYLRNLLRDQRQWVKNGDTIINDYYLAMGKPLAEALLIPRIEIKDGEVLYLNGAALLKENRLFCWIEQERLHSNRWITGGTEICTLPADARKESVIVEVQKEPCRWKLLSSEPLKVQANLRGTLLITENSSFVKPRTAEQRQAFYQEIQKQMETQLTEQIQKEFALLQTQRCDSLKLGRWLYAWHPELVQPERWAEQFSDIQIEIHLETRVQSEA